MILFFVTLFTVKKIALLRKAWNTKMSLLAYYVVHLTNKITEHLFIHSP